MQGVDYSASLSFDAGNEPVSATISLVQPLPAGWTMTIARIVPLVQETAFFNQGGMAPELVEAALDYLMMAIQQVDARTFTANALEAVRQDLLARIVALQASKIDQAQLDAALGGKANVVDVQALAGIVFGKADAAALDQLAAVVGGKANAADVQGNVSALQGQINILKTEKADIADVDAGDALLQDQIFALAERMPDAHSLAEEIAAREAADAELSQRIHQETREREDADDALRNDAQRLVADEAAAREAKDAQLDGKVSDNTLSISNLQAEKMDKAPANGTYLASGGAWVPFEVNAGFIFDRDASGFVFPVTRPAYYPDQLFHVDGMFVCPLASAQSGARNNLFVVDSAGFIVLN